MKVSTRIALNVFGPPVIGSFFLAVITVASEQMGFSGVPAMFAAILVYGCFFSVIPSIAHATLMEVIYRYLPAHKLTAVIIASASGFIAGAVVVIALSGGTGSWAEPFYRPIDRTFPAIGLATGLTLGLLVMALSSKKSSSENTVP